MGFRTFQQRWKTRVQTNLSEGKSISSSLGSKFTEKLAFYDYIGNNPAKGWSLFLKLLSDSSVCCWLGHAILKIKKVMNFFVRQMPTFFENFSVLLLRQDGVVSRCTFPSGWILNMNVEQVGVSVSFYGGEFRWVTLSWSCWKKNTRHFSN